MKAVVFIIVALFSIELNAQCFTAGTGDDEASTKGDWTNNSSWVGSSPGCNVSISNREIEIDIADTITVQSTSCSGNGLRISGESAKLQVLDGSTLFIEGDFRLGDKICLYVDSTSEIIIDGDLRLDDEKATIDIDGVLNVLGDINCVNCDPDKVAFTGTGTIYSQGCVGFGGSSNCQNATSPPLPIELISFQAFVVDQSVEVSWSTASEVNTEVFYIERSKHLSQWDMVDAIDGAGYSNEVINYKSIDYNPLGGISYYRLKQVDLDHQFTYSDVISVFVEDMEGIHLNPNPASDRVTLSASRKLSPAEFRWIDPLGNELIFPVDHHEAYIEFQTTGVTPGIYFLQYLGGAREQVIKVVFY